MMLFARASLQEDERQATQKIGLEGTLLLMFPPNFPLVVCINCTCGIRI